MLTSLTLFGQPYIQGAIYVSINDITIKVKPNQQITHGTGAVFNFNIAVSVNSNGQAIGNAPVPNSVTCNVAGVTVNSLGVTLIDNRFTYTYTIIGNATNAINWPANVEQDFLFIDFPANPLMTGQFPRLEDQTNDGGGPSQQSYFYADILAFDYTNYASLFYAGGGGTLGSDSNGDQYVQSGTALPIKLSDFSVSKAGERTARLLWHTEREQNSDFFGIERSEDGATWEAVGTVKAAGFSAGRLAYEYFDTQFPNVRSKDELYYYRLRMTDLDGTYEYSEIRAIDFRSMNDVGDVRVFPNPASNQVHIDLSSWDAGENVRLRLADGNGRIVIDRQINWQGIYILDTDLLENGAYTILMDQGTQTVAKRVVILK